MSNLYEKEHRIALLAVQRAAIITQRVYRDSSKGTLSKADSSPVTIGDFGAQALVISALQHSFPEDEIVAEEESSALRNNTTLRDRVFDVVKSTKLEDETADAELGGPVDSEEKLLRVIDGGKSPGGNKGRIWVLDPIDGTKGFVRGGQYAIALALLVNGEVKVGVLGCPNIPVDPTAEHSTENIQDYAGPGRGVLVSAVKDHGALSRLLETGALAPAQRISMTPVTDITKAIYLESYVSLSFYSSSALQHRTISHLSLAAPPIGMDSQAKYAALARGSGHIYLRLPAKKGYEECIWDHAAGALIVGEAGGVVTDEDGKRLDFGLGRTLKGNSGIVVAEKSIHWQVLEAVKEALKERSVE